jgi:serine/threonine protein phosphatase 1
LVKTLLINKIQGNEKPLTSYKKVFVGHTPTINFEEADPIVYGGVCMIDTGAGWAGGTLSMMDIDKMSLFKSDKVDMLYKDFSGRSGI